MSSTTYLADDLVQYLDETDNVEWHKPIEELTFHSDTVSYDLWG